MKVNKDWVQRQLEIMNSDTRVNELCKCLTKTPEWKYHKQYCPVWKNGRIAELEQILIDFDSAFMSEDIHDLGKAHEATVLVLKNRRRGA